MKIHAYQKIAAVSILAMVVLYIVFVPLGANLNFDNPIENTSPTNTSSVVPTELPKTQTNNTTATPTKPPASAYILYFVSQADCPYCAEMHPLVLTWAAAHKNVELREVTTGTDLSNSFNVRSAPTTILVDKATGKERTRFVGIFDTNDLNKYVSG
jgi:thioredoxin-related protein